MAERGERNETKKGRQQRSVISNDTCTPVYRDDDDGDVKSMKGEEERCS